MFTEQALMGLVALLLATLLGYGIGMSKGLGRLEGTISGMSKRMEQGFSMLREEVRTLGERVGRLEEGLRKPAPAGQGVEESS